MFFKRKPEPEVDEKPDYWTSPYYVGWRCNGCGIVTNYENAKLGEPKCCGDCGCQTFREVVGRERRIAGDWESKGQWFARGVDVPAE